MQASGNVSLPLYRSLVLPPNHIVVVSGMPNVMNQTVQWKQNKSIQPFRPELREHWSV